MQQTKKIQKNKAVSNFLLRNLNENNNFIYLHRLRLNKSDIEKIINNRVVVEVDISYDPITNKPYIGHPNFNNKFLLKKILLGDYHNNISFDELKKIITEHRDLNIIFDCKDDRVLPYFEDLLQEVGPSRIVFHAFISEWSIFANEAHFNSNPVRHESLSIKKILDFIRKTNSTWIGTTLVSGWNDVNNTVLNHIKNTSGNKIKAIAFYPNLIDIIFPNIEVNQAILGKGFIPVFFVDFLLSKPKFKYIGVTNLLKKATKINYEI